MTQTYKKKVKTEEKYYNRFEKWFNKITTVFLVDENMVQP